MEILSPWYSLILTRHSTLWHMTNWNCLLVLVSTVSKSNLLEWLKNFFKNRTHRTKVGYTLSSIAELMSGVVQGSGIGPTAFLIFLDNLAKKLESQGVQLKIFADDVKVYLSVCNSGTASCAKLYPWMSYWLAVSNIHKQVQRFDYC